MRATPHVMVIGGCDEKSAVPFGVVTATTVIGA